MVIKSYPLLVKDTETCVGSSLASNFVLFSLISLVSFYFVFILLISFRFVSFLLISFRFVSFRFRWFRFVSFLFRFALYRYPFFPKSIQNIVIYQNSGIGNISWVWLSWLCPLVYWLPKTTKLHHLFFQSFDYEWT
jgi:hypothetical protein